MTSCENTSPIFGQPPLTNVDWVVPLAYQDINFTGIIGSEPYPPQDDPNTGEPVIIPNDLTNCQLDLYIDDINGNQIAHWSSTGGSPEYTIYPGTIVYPNPNYKLFVSNATLNTLFQVGQYPFNWVLTDSTGSKFLLFSGNMNFV